jgi:hypothetical protein
VFQLTGLRDALETLGAVLAARRTPYALVAVGGGSLLLLGLIERPTRDLDVIALAGTDRYTKLESVPEPLAAAARDVADTFGLADDWLNVAPAALLDFGLPAGFECRTVVQRFGALELHIASRLDQICLKLYAAVDQGPRSKHLVDLEALRPSEDELGGAAGWALTHDPSPGFRRELDGLLAHFRARGHDG